MPDGRPQRILLYGCPHSPYAARVSLALEEAKADYQRFFFDLDERPEWYVEKINPNGKVPALVYGGPESPPNSPSLSSTVLTESAILLEFIADLYPASNLLPTNPLQRAHARAFIAALDDKYRDALLPLLTGADGGAAALALLAELQARLPPAGYVLGEHWSIADAAFVPLVVALQVAARTGRGAYRDIDGGKMLEALEEPRFERLREYLALNKARPSWKEIVAQNWVKRFRAPPPFGPAK
ncbi:thioredoxin-like protein [Lenzites betulinus]|nr:thioredoxin-like protein [Lenzites betulinus]